MILISVWGSDPDLIHSSDIRLMSPILVTTSIPQFAVFVCSLPLTPVELVAENTTVIYASKYSRVPVFILPDYSAYSHYTLRITDRILGTSFHKNLHFPL